MAGPFEGRLSHFIRQRREQLTLTQQQLAATIDVCPDYIARLESGHAQLDLSRVYPLADALATDHTYFCLLVTLEGTSHTFQKYFGDWLLAEVGKGCHA